MEFYSKHAKLKSYIYIYILCARATCEVTGQLQMNIGVQLSLNKTNRPMSASQISNLTC